MGAVKYVSRLTLFVQVVVLLVSAQQEAPLMHPSNADYLPLIFEPNSGQAPADVAFVARGAYPIFLESDGAVLVVAEGRTESEAGAEATASVVTLQLLGSNPSARASGLDLLPGKSNYYIGANPKNWRSGIPQYAGVTFKSVYPGVDLVYYGNEGQLEYDLVLSPGVDPSLVRFRAEGAESMELSGAGNVMLRAGQSTIELRQPAIYQKDADGSRKPVSGRFVVNGNEIRVEVGEYQKDKQLIVDPVLSFSTLIGSNNDTTVSGVAADSSGDMYITGYTSATNYPTVNAFQSKNNGRQNIFVTKLNPSGNVILYSTYLGGGGFDGASGIAVDSSGSAYITGTATSTDFPTTAGAFMTTCPSYCQTGFVSKFLSDGTLSFSTYMGGSAAFGKAIAVDSQGAAYIAGTIDGNDLPTTTGSFQTTKPGDGSSAYVEKLNATGSALDYSTYFGSMGTPANPTFASGAGIALDTSGSAYLVGNATGIPTRNPIQATYVSDTFMPNAFIAKFSPDGSSLEYSTYLGGSSSFFFSYAGDYATSVAVDASGNAHVAGTSSSCDFPLSLSAVSTACVNTEYDQKIFALVLNPTGTQLLFSTFLASGNTPSIAVDASGNSYIAGDTTSYQFPVLNAIESTSLQSSQTTFVTELDSTGKLLFSTYFGSSYGATSGGIAIDGNGGIYVAGFGQADFPLLNPIPSQIIQQTGYTIFASKIAPNNAPQFSLAPRVSPVLALRNVSSSLLTIDSIVPSSNFTMGGNCGSSLAPGTGCTLILEGAKDHKSSGSVSITTNAGTSTFTISKSPNGDANVGPLVSASPTLLQFPPQYMGTTSLPQTITLQNAGTQSATITGISLGQPFNQTNNCPAVLSPSSSCTISVTYTAATANDYSSVSIGLNPGSEIDVNVYSLLASSTFTLSTASMQFGDQTAGVRSVSRLVNLTNTSDVPATAPAITITGGFTQTNNCTGVLAPDASCRILVSFVPTGNQLATGTLTANSYGPGGAQTVSLSATGIAAGDLSLSPVTLNLVSAVGYPTSQEVTVTNDSQNVISIRGRGGIYSSPPFTETNTCTTNLAPGATCQITVAWNPAESGPVSGSLFVSYVGKGSPQRIVITGTTTQGPGVQFAPPVVQFAPQPVNTTSPESYTDLWNDAGTTATLGTVSIQGSAFSIASNPCGSSLPPLYACGVSVVFTPKSQGLQTGTLSVTANNSTTPVTATLQGTGVSDGVGSLSASSVIFGSQSFGTQSGPQYVTLSNIGTGPLGITSIAVSPSSFVQQNNCGSSLAAGTNCTITLTFAPNVYGMLVGSLTVQNDGAGTPQTSLSGTGQ